MKQFSNRLSPGEAEKFYDETIQFIEDNINDIMSGKEGGAILIMTAHDNKLRPTLLGGDENSLAEMLTDIIMRHPGMASRVNRIIALKYNIRVTDITDIVESMEDVSRTH